MVDAEPALSRSSATSQWTMSAAAINPMIVHGQTHGGIAQGVGQALLENSHYDPATASLLAASFMDYRDATRQHVPRVRHGR